jgi:hypothetical protein
MRQIRSDDASRIVKRMLSFGKADAVLGLIRQIL